MKGMDIFCASQASTAICLSMDQASSSSSSIIQLGGRAIDRHNPIIRDERRITRALPSAPCSSSQSPINPRPYHQLQKSKKSSSSARRNDQSKRKGSSHSKQDGDDNIKKSISSSTPSDGTVRRSFAKPSDLITPPGSSRYLLSDHSVYFDGLSDYDPVALVPFGNKKNQTVVNQEEAINAPKDNSSSEYKPQVVVLRVSLHCKGCEGKVRKHLSRMKGVSSYNIDFAAKKVTVVGDVTPLSVLASVSKVKTAQFWPAPSASAAGPAASNAQIKK